MDKLGLPIAAATLGNEANSWLYDCDRARAEMICQQKNENSNLQPLIFDFVRVIDLIIGTLKQRVEQWGQIFPGSLLKRIISLFKKD